MQEDCEVLWLRTSVLQRYIRNCETRNEPEKFRDFRETGLRLRLCYPNLKFISNSSRRPETDDVYVSAKQVRRYGLPDISDTESSEEDEDQPEGDDSDDEDDVSNTGSTSRSWCAIS